MERDLLQISDALVQSVKTNTVLYQTVPSRRMLLELDTSHFVVSREVSINVWRNHNFEILLPLISPYLSYAGVRANWRIGSYDDSLSFVDHLDSDIEFLWLDVCSHVEKLSFKVWLNWIISRLKSLRQMTNAPIVVVTWFSDSINSLEFKDCISKIPGVYFGDVGEQLRDIDFLSEGDPRASMSATRIRNAAHTRVARKVATTWVMGCLPQVIKVIAVDLDNTLYEGVVGEDGPNGVHLRQSHIKLQNALVKVAERGVVLAIVSKNDVEDVDLLFEQRPDFPLRRDHFTFVEASWISKAESIVKVISAANVGLDSVLFIDDNLAEVYDVVTALPEVKVVYAPTPDDWIAGAVVGYPGIEGFSVLSSDRARKSDLQANVERKTLLEKHGDFAGYQRELNMALKFHVDSPSISERIANLSKKTNQFNLALQRMSTAEVQTYVTDANSSVVAVSLSDRLADSGVIGFVAASVVNDTMYVNEVCISCRALGRGLENYIIGLAILSMPFINTVQHVAFKYTNGPRNIPALEWLKTLLSSESSLNEEQMTIPVTVIQSLTNNCILEVSVIVGE